MFKMIGGNCLAMTLHKASVTYSESVPFCRFFTGIKTVICEVSSFLLIFYSKLFIV